MATLIKIDRNGTKYYTGMCDCPRCDGKGIYYIGVCNGHLVPSHVDQGLCFQCGGSGKVEGKWKEYTPEYEAKLNERRAKKAEERAKIWREQEEARRAEEEARKAKEEAERIAKEEAIRAKKAQSKHIGQVGDKIEMTVTVEKQAYFDIPSFRGFGTDTMWVYTFRTEDGNALVWKTTKCVDMEDGDKIILKGTIKEHSEYKDERQTVLTRCKITK